MQRPPVRQATVKKSANFSSMPFWMGLALSVLWIGVVGIALTGSGTAQTFAGLPLANWAIGISAVASPVALIWMVTAYLQRAADVQSIAEPLRRQLMMITGESGAAEVRIRRFNQSLREQIELLRGTQTFSQNDLVAIMDRVRQHKNDLEQFEQHSVYQVKEIQEVIRRSMQHIEQLLEDKFTMLRILDSKLVQSGDEVARQTETVRDQMTSMLQEIEANAHLVSLSLERASRDGKKLADTAHAQEASLVSATETASSSLQELSGKIDLTIAHFLERVGTARDEAERLGGTLETQTRMLDEVSNTLPARINETEALLRGVTDRLFASEQMARQQAVQLGEHLDAQSQGLEQILNRFTARLNDVDGHLQQRRSDLDGLVVRISGATDDLAQKLDSSITGLGERTQESLRQFTIVNDEARRGADDVASHMAETTARYESVIRQLNGLAEGNSTHVRAMTEEMGAQLVRFEALNNASQQAGQEVQARAGVALQNLQHVLERLLAARDATQTVGETLTNNLRSAVQQNDNIITRINEAAQMTLHALGAASDSLIRKEGDIATQSHAAESALRTTIGQLEEKARTAEQSLREQNASLVNLMKETQERLDGADLRLQDFAARAALPVHQAMQQIEQSTNQGTDTLERYSGKMMDHLGRLQQLNTRVGDVGEETSRMTTDTLNALEQFNNRFLTVRAAQEETARSTLEQFSTMAERLQREVGVLGDHTTKAVDTLHQAAAQVGQQSQDLLREAQDSGSKIQVVTSALQNEAAQIRATLQKQADDLNNDLSRAERQFMSIGESLKQRTDAAYALLDRMAAHYNDTTRGVTDEFEERATKLGQTASSAHDKVGALSSAIAQQASLIGNNAVQMESQATQLVSTGAKTLQQLSTLNEKLSLTQEATASGAQQVISRLEETNSAFLRQNNSLSESAQNAVMMIQKAGAAYGEQASKMLDTTHQVEQSIRGLNAATTAFADQTTQIRSAMEQHNQRLVTSLNESVGQLDGASLKMQQATSHAAQGVESAATRFSEITKDASGHLDGSSEKLLDIAGKAESTLSALGASITQQVASLNLVSEQMDEQHRAMTAANESQRTQLLDLFEKLGSAHGQASDVAERTIARLTDSLQQIHRQLGALSDQSQTALADIRTTGSGFADQATLLFQNAQQAEQQARTILSVTSALQDQARQLREALHAEGERTGDLLGGILGKLGSGNSELRELTSTAEITLTSLHQGVTNQTTALNGVMQQITDRQRSLTTSLDAQRDVLNGLLNRMSLAQDETASVAERNAAKITDSSRLITTHMEEMDTQAQSTLTSVQNASASFISEADTLGRHAEQAEQLTRLLSASTSTLQDQARQVRETMQTESEQLSDMLGTMLSKLGSSNVALQDLSSTTGTRLTDLQGTIDAQTTALNGMMQQIGERQRDLTSTLETQRETMGGLINRLSLAQDEIASTAERNTNRLSESAQQIARQIEVIDAQAQNTLASVRAAGAGFADEAGSLNVHAQQTEQQTRGLLSVTAGMEEQARQLRESMQNESARVIEHLTSVISQLDVTSQQLRQQSGNMVNSLDQSVLQITTLANTTDEALKKHAISVTDIAEKAEGRVLEAGEKIRTHFKVVADAGEQADQQAKQLADTAEHANSRLAALRKTMADSDQDGRNILVQASTRIDDIKATLQRELQQVAEISQLAVQQVTAAGQVLITHSDSLRANLSSSESALTQAADLVREETVQIPAVLDRSTAHIDATRKTFEAQADEVNKTMVQTTDRFISVTGAARDTMMEEMRNLGTVANTADETLRQFNQALVEQLEAIKKGSTELSTEQSVLVDKTAQTIAQLTSASDRLAQVRTSALQTTEKLAREFESIETMATSTTQRLAQAGEGLGKQVTQLAQVAERAEGQMTGASQGLREQLERIRSGVQMQIDDINRGLMQITAQLERTGNTLRSATAGAVSDVEKITTRLDQTSKDTSHQLTDRTARMRVATEEVAKLLGGFGDQMDVLLNRLSTAGDGIKRQESDLIGRLQSALSHLGSITEKLETNRMLTADVADEAVSRLSGVSAAVEKQLHELKQGSDNVSGIIKGMGQLYGDQTQGMNRNLADTQSQILSMNKSVEEMQQRTDRMRVALKLQGDDLMNTLEQILHQLSTTGDIFGDVIQTAEQKAAEGGQKLS
ncbi:MAG: hypothetical protein PHY92_00745 [Alphaproteobacteria bacterium]|nr:hypothetical protein [Alphaproteobacteria bacterium]